VAGPPPPLDQQADGLSALLVPALQVEWQTIPLEQQLRSRQQRGGGGGRGGGEGGATSSQQQQKRQHMLAQVTTRSRRGAGAD